MTPINISSSIYGDMQPLEPLLKELEIQFPGEFMEISSAQPRWPIEAWSNTFILHRKEGTSWFLKGTPRFRREARVTEELYIHDPHHIPHIIILDLSPDLSWRWFIMESAGNPVIDDNNSFIDDTLPIEAVRTLAQVQKRVSRSQLLPTLIPRCGPDQLRDTALEACSWYSDHDKANLDEYKEVIRAIKRDDVFFSSLYEALSRLPCHIVHSDFWGGNTVRNGSVMKIIDWGDAVWGIGGMSILSLLDQHKEQLREKGGELWAAYADEIGHPIDASYISACQEARKVMNIVIHHQINACCAVRPELHESALRCFGALMQALKPL